jgi:hypothetical protein
MKDKRGAYTREIEEWEKALDKHGRLPHTGPHSDADCQATVKKFLGEDLAAELEMRSNDLRRENRK